MFGFVRSSEIDALRSENTSLKRELAEEKCRTDSYIRKLDRASFASAAEEEKHRKEVEDLKLQIENLERERDILRKYYDLDSEPTPEMKAEIRLCEKVHKLELENIELRMNVNSFTNYVNKKLYDDLLSEYNRNCRMTFPPLLIQNGMYWR